MSDSIRAALERLIELRSTDTHALLGLNWHDAFAAARAALAEPVGEAIGPEWQPCVKLPITVHVREQRPGETHVSTREGITPVQPDDLIMRGVQGEEYPIGRELFNQTYRLGVAEPTPPAEGEVAQLVAWLRAYANGEQAEGRSATGRSLARAAELLQQFASPPCLVLKPSPEALAALKAAGPGRIELLPDDAQIIEPSRGTLLVPVPTPVPVSERLPEPEDCDVEGRCWQWTPFEEGTNFPAPGDWGLQFGEWLSNVHCETTHWLPAHALPLPQGEVEK